MLSQDTLTRDRSGGAASPGEGKGPGDRGDAKTPPGEGFIPAPMSLTSFGSDRRSLTNSYDSLARKRQNKTGVHPNPSEVEDAELLLAHRGDPGRPFNRGVSVRNAASTSGKTQAPVQPLDSPVRPGRKNDKRSTVGYPGDPRHNDFGQQRGQSSFGYATLGRNSFKTGSVKANFLGGNYSTGKIGSSVPTSPPPPPPPPPLPPVTTNHILRSPDSEQVDVLLRSSSKKTTAPLPPQLTSSISFPLTSADESQVRSSSFTYSPQYSVAPATSQAPKSGSQNSSVQRPGHPLNVTAPYHKPQPSDKSATPSSGKAANPLATESAVGSPDKRRDSPTDIPIRILRKYPEGLVTPPGTKSLNLEILAPPKPPPPLRNSSMAGEQTPTSSDPQPARQLSRTNSFKQQSAPKDCPPLQKAAPLIIGDPSNNNANSLDVKNNNN